MRRAPARCCAAARPARPLGPSGRPATSQGSPMNGHQLAFRSHEERPRSRPPGGSRHARPDAESAGGGQAGPARRRGHHPAQVGVSARCTLARTRRVSRPSGGRCGASPSRWPHRQQQADCTASIDGPCQPTRPNAGRPQHRRHRTGRSGGRAPCSPTARLICSWRRRWLAASRSAACPTPRPSAPPGESGPPASRGRARASAVQVQLSVGKPCRRVAWSARGIAAAVDQQRQPGQAVVISALPGAFRIAVGHERAGGASAAAAAGPAHPAGPVVAPAASKPGLAMSIVRWPSPAGVSAAGRWRWTRSRRRRRCGTPSDSRPAARRRRAGGQAGLSASVAPGRVRTSRPRRCRPKVAACRHVAVLGSSIADRPAVTATAPTAVQRCADALALVGSAAAWPCAQAQRR